MSSEDKPVRDNAWLGRHYAEKFNIKAFNAHRRLRDTGGKDLSLYDVAKIIEEALDKLEEGNDDVVIVGLIMVTQTVKKDHFAIDITLVYDRETLIIPR
jgi:hypothetical protein